MATHYSIHPSIGIARLGNSPDAIMFAPEAALGLPAEPAAGGERPVASFRDSQGRIRREAARFRVYRREDGQAEPGRPVRIGEDDLVDVEWTVWLANKKASWFTFQGPIGDEPGPHRRNRNDHVAGNARMALIIDPGPRTVGREHRSARFTAAQAPDGHVARFPPATLSPFRIETLGELRRAEDATLLVLGGFGASGTTDDVPAIRDYANNDNWFDDVSDGPVSATLVFGDGRRVTVEGGAWVICAPPAYAPEVGNIVTLYDAMFDVAVRLLGRYPEIFANGRFRDDFRVNFTTDLQPFFRRVESIRGVEMRIPQHSHLLDWAALRDPSDGSAPYRRRLLEIVRRPDDRNATHAASGRVMMPHALGDDPYSPTTSARYLAVTPTQMHLLERWAAGDFHIGAQEPEAAQQLDRAALSNCVGGAFYPGIETTWIVRDPRIYAAPFRIRHRDDLQDGLHLEDALDRGLEPGDLTKRMAVPWQADFYECERENNGGLRDVAWWPAQRPLTVLDESFQPVEWTRGFVLNTGPNRPADLQMVHNWKDLGFVRSRQIGPNKVFVETERNGDSITGAIA